MPDCGIARQWLASGSDDYLMPNLAGELGVAARGSLDVGAIECRIRANSTTYCWLPAEPSILADG